MATKPLTTEAIALTEKKMDMSLDDIIKLSKSNAGNVKKQRVSNKSRRAVNDKQDRSMKIKKYMDSRSTLRQGVLAQRRSNFQGNSFPLASDAARKAAAAPFRNGGFNRNRAVNWNRPSRCGGFEWVKKWVVVVGSGFWLRLKLKAGGVRINGGSSIRRKVEFDSTVRRWFKGGGFCDGGWIWWFDSVVVKD